MKKWRETRPYSKKEIHDMEINILLPGNLS